MKKVFFCLFGLLLLAGVSYGESPINADMPSTMLVFPYFSSDDASETLISVTNVNCCFEWNTASGRFFGSVWAHFYYVDGEDCDVTNVWEYLTPCDMVSVIASDHNPAFNYGFLWVIAADTNTRKPVDWDYKFTAPSGISYDSGLIGDTLIADGRTAYLWAIPSIGVKGKTGGPGNLLDTEGDGLDFGDELQGFPDKLFISSFVEIGALNSDAELVLLTFLDADYRIDLDFLFYNNMEVETSQDWDFRCWVKEDLKTIFNGADSLGGDTTHPYFFVETGWASVKVDKAVNDMGGGGTVDADEVPILGMIIQRIVNGNYSGAHVLHHTYDDDVEFTLDY